MGLHSRSNCQIVFSVRRGSVSVLVWALNDIGLPKFCLLLLITVSSGAGAKTGSQGNRVPAIF